MTCVVQNPNGMNWLRTDQANGNKAEYVWTETVGSTNPDLYSMTTTVVGTTTTYELTVSLKTFLTASLIRVYGHFYKGFFYTFTK